jgi:putative DNA methylase
VNVISPKKLIEVALPLDAINAAAAREKSIRHGHPSTLHLWWARRPLAAARAVLFAQLVHDPEDLWRCQNPGVEPNAQVKGHWTRRRNELFRLIEDLVKWENTTNETVLEKARAEIRRSWRETCELNKHHPDAATLFNPDKMPGLHDPFAGGGTIPLEAQRLGLEAYASDLNPVAVLINKAMIEIPPKFAGKAPVSRRAAEAQRKEKDLLSDLRASAALREASPGASGLAEDVRYYGQWMRDEAFKRIGHLYPPIEITKEMVKERPDLKPYEGEKLTVIAWLWARTVKSPNPAFSHVEVPLASTFILSSKPGKEAYVQPVICEDSRRDAKTQSYVFKVKVGKPPAEAKKGTKAARGANFRCLMSNVAIHGDYIKAEAVAGRMGQKLMAIVAEGNRGRVYLSPTNDHEEIAKKVNPANAAEAIHVPIANDPRALWCLLYGLTHFDHLFTSRQLVALTTFSDLVGEARERIRQDAIAAGLPDDDTPLDAGGTGARAYAEAVSVYLGFVIGRCGDYWSCITTWYPGNQQIGHAFTKQAIPMVWDFAEANPLSSSSGSWRSLHHTTWDAFKGLTVESQSGLADQHDVRHAEISQKFISTDPPYYDNIGYADLSDFFYVWLRRSLRPVFPNLLATIAVPKAEELVATPYRHGSKQKAEKFFLDGMTQAMHNLAVQAHPAAPITIYYAFKQSESEKEGTNNTGWETFLEAVLKSGLSVTGTWPMRSEQHHRMLAHGTNALASSIVLVCRPRAKDAGTIDRRRFQRLLNEALPLALDAMTRESEGLHSPVAPVDLSQAIIGPGMAIFSRYEAVLEADGTPMTVKTALQLINRFLAEDDFDADTQFCLHWFEQHGWEAGKFGEADTLARAKGTSVDGVKAAGVIESGGGKVRLLKWRELDTAWDPAKDPRIPVWQVLHQMILSYNREGDSGAARIYSHPKVSAMLEPARQLAYRLYTLCERQGWAEDARAYNEVVTGWSGIESAASKVPGPVQGTLFENTEDNR